jgi:predicted aspartyl protease
VPKIITSKSPYLYQNGPTYSVVIKPSFITVGALHLEKKDISFIKISALIDTGAQTTAISQKVVDSLKLVPRGTAKIYTSQSSKIVNEYDITLEFDTDAYIDTLRVVGADLQDHSIDCLIGRDVLKYGVFTYNGPKQEFKLSFGEI